MKPTPTLLAIAIALGLSGHAHAETAADARTLDTILVKGEREQKSANQNVTVIDSKQLEDEMAQSMDDVIRYVPGVSMVDFGRFGSNGFNIRGLEGDQVAITLDGLSFPETLDSDTYTPYEYFRSGRGGLDIDAVKSVEIVKGADSITAGSGALSGAVVFTTKDPADYLKGQGNDTHFGLKYGYADSNDENMGTLTFANRTDIVESLLVYTKRKGHETESWYDTTEAQMGPDRRMPDPIDRDSNNLLGKVDFVISDAHRFGLVWERARATTFVDNLTRTDGTGSYFQRTADDSSDRDRYGMHYSWRADNAAFDNLEVTADRQENISRGVTDILTASGTVGGTRCTPAAPCPRQENRNSTQVLDRIAVDLGKSFDTGSLQHGVAYGLAWQQREIEWESTDYRWNNAGQPVSEEIDNALWPETETSSWNVYVRDRIKLLDDRLTFTAGARYDRYDYSPTVRASSGDDSGFPDNSGSIGDVSFSSPTWQLGTDYRFAPNQSLWVQAGRGFRAPSVGDMYNTTSTTQATIAGTGETVTLPSSVSNPNLESEKSLNLEAGYRWESNNVRFGVSLFRDKYTNFIESATIQVDNGVQYQTCSRGACTITTGYSYNMPVNRGEVVVRGLEAEGMWLMSDAWMGRMAFTYNHGEKSDGQPLGSINPAKLVIGLNYAAPSQRWGVTGSLTHQIAKEPRNAGTSVTNSSYGEEVPAPYLDKASEYTVFDLYGTFNVTKNLRINAGVYNLFDKEYYLWSRIRTVGAGTAVFQGNTSEEGIGRYSEPGRNFRVTLAYTF